MFKETIAKKILNVNWKESTSLGRGKLGRIKTVASQPAAKLTKRAEKTLSHGRVKNLSIKNILTKTGEKVNKTLRVYFKKQKRNELLGEIERITFAGGKRLRPALFYYAYQACGGKNERLAVNIGTAIEIFHTFALIHDDILDKSDLRRGKATVHKKIGFEGAILAGDLCLTFANDLFYKTITKTKLNSTVLHRTVENWQKMQEEACLGEYLDISLNWGKSPNLKARAVQIGDFLRLEKQVWKVMEYKTGRYTIERPLHLAASLADAPKEIFTAFSKYGRNLGIAFQIKDDILGMFGEEKVIGKPADSDLKEGKITLLIAGTISKLNPAPEQVRFGVAQNRSPIWFLGKTKNLKLKRLLSFLGNRGATRKDLEWVRNLIKETGTLDYSQNKAKELVKKAKKAIKNSSLKTKDKKFFLELADYVVERKY